MPEPIAGRVQSLESTHCVNCGQSVLAAEPHKLGECGFTERGERFVTPVAGLYEVSVTIPNDDGTSRTLTKRICGQECGLDPGHDGDHKPWIVPLRDALPYAPAPIATRWISFATDPDTPIN